MAIIAKNTGGSSYEPLEAGNYPARCISMIRIGTIEEEYKGQKKWMDKVTLTFEIPDEQRVFTEAKGLQPYVFSKDFTLSMYEKANLRKVLESWRGKAFPEVEAEKFDITKLLGKPCMINVIHKTSGKGSTYADISSLATLPKGLECPEQVNPTLELSFDNWSAAIFESLPDFVKEKIKKSKEYAAMTSPGHTETPQSNSDSDDLPF